MYARNDPLKPQLQKQCIFKGLDKKDMSMHRNLFISDQNIISEHNLT